MKKNKILRLASVMLMLCLITTCAISGTFAKYTTSGTASDTARVAKWGVVLEVSGNDKAFATAYEDDVANASGTEVKASTKVVAPGTEGVLATYKFTGTPEVAFTLTAVVDFELGDGWTASGYYCPLEVKIGSTVIKGTTYANVTEFEEAVEDAIATLIFGEAVDDTTDGTYAKDYVVGDTVPQVGTATNIEWKWAYTGNDDGKDTLLGDAGSATVTFSLNVSATQID